MNKLYFFILLFIISCFTLSAQTNFDEGDLLVYAVNTNVNSFCTTNYFNSTEFVDEVFLVTFKDILPNTIIYITDNGWQRKLNNFFGTTEGVLKLTKKIDSTIEKGEVFSIKIPAGLTNSNLNSLNPLWNCEKVTNGIFNIASIDQFFIFNNGNWSMDMNEDHKGIFTNTTLVTAYNNQLNWDNYLDLGVSETRNSGLPGDEVDDNYDITNFHLTTNLQSAYSYYDGSKSITSKNEWILRFLNPNYWISTPSCSTFQNNIVYQKFTIDEESKSFKICKNTPVNLAVDNNTIVTYQWFSTSVPATTNGNAIAGATSTTYSPDTSVSGTIYYYCDLSYTLKWKNSNISKSKTAVLKSLLYKVEVVENKLTPIEY